jgi:hypothetical protein
MTTWAKIHDTTVDSLQGKSGLDWAAYGGGYGREMVAAKGARWVLKGVVTAIPERPNSWYKVFVKL